MKNKYLLVLFIFGFSTVFSSVQAQVDSLSVQPLIPQDSIPTSYEWSVRSPLSAAEKQRREDNRAEVEDMKRRFREYHESIPKEDKQVIKTTDEQDYLWNDPVNDSVEGEQSINPNENTEIEALQQEIKRNFQNQVVLETIVIPNSAESEFQQADTNWQEKAFQTPSTSSGEWALNLDQHQNTLAQPLRIGQVHLLERVQFEVQSIELSLQARNDLNNWQLLYQQHPNMKIEVGAHTRQKMGYSQALELSTQRARVINDYLISLGIPAAQIIFKGYGKLFPLFLASDEANYHKNERIEVIILELPDH